MLRTGTVLDRRYRIEHVIKQGGMGTVYAAQDLRLDRPCAVKAVQATTEQERAQYEREARVLGRLCHPHLPAIFDCLEEEDSVFVVMQMIPGDDLEAMTLRSGPPVWETLVGWGLQLAEAVQYLHDQAPPVIHRDIKPANIRLAPHGQIYLVDFGIAKVLDGAATVTAARAASVPYAPIEQVQDGSHTNQQSDIYSFGATLYRLLTGTLPPSCIDRLVGKDLPPVSSFNPAVPDSLARLVHHCMELWSTDRPATMTAVIATLRPLQLGVTQTIPEARTLPMNTFSGGTTRRTEAVGHTPQAYGALKAGLKALERGDAETARGLFTQAIELAKAFAEAYAARAAACTQLGLYHAALDDWNAAINLRPRRSAWYRQRALVHRQLEDTAAAIGDLSTAIEL
ncbi:MAG: protein kinase, partial [Chloroflexota bacterium]|nr:protein kinase [Chloroflexota bacterium]